MSQYSSEHLLNAVSAICPDIMDRVEASSKKLNEKHLWWELSSCILSSQVPYDLAVAAADQIASEELLVDDNLDPEDLLYRLIATLRKPLNVKGRQRSYRFPVARAHYLSAARVTITSEKCSLLELVDRFKCATDARAWFVKNLPGIGPKQASMLLRNIGASYDLAILDRHVLNYMSKLGIYSGTDLYISGLKPYLRHESVLREHAQDLDCPVGILDWAIWIVMRVANQNMERAAV